jgi:hypothetical protein
MKRRRLGSRSKRYKPRLPGVLGWSFVVLGGLAALVVVAFLHGKEPPANEEFWSSLHDTLAEPAVTGLAAFVAALFIAWGVRHLLLDYLAWRPGPIITEEFAVSSEVKGADAKQLTATFRDRLAFSHLQSAAPVPAPAAQGNFLDVVTGGGGGGGGLVGSLLTLLRAAAPDHAYQVKGTLVSRADPRGCGVTVHVVGASGEADPVRTFWDSSWDGVTRRAADHATASILPRTRLSRAPWSGWRGFELPSELFHSYERAAELERGRRYDEALDLYYKALEADPMNLGLRLQIGFLQEKLALFLDALATYQGIFEVARPGERQAVSSDSAPDLLLTRRARRDRLRQFYRLPARRDREAVLLVAKYRRAILLGGQELPRQWAIRRSGARTNRRDVQRHQLRDRLRPALMDLFPQERDLDPVLAQPEQKGAPELRRRFEELLVRTAIGELSELRRQLPRHRPRNDGDLSRQAVDLARLWMQERLARIMSGPVLAADELGRSIRKIEGRTRGFRRWQEHYNAACVYALPLLARTSRRDTDEVDEFSTLAVKCLKKAIACADSGYVASRRDWLISDDPDLDGLRPERAFKSFEAMYFPAAARTPRRPRDLHKWEVSRYTIDLLAATADRWEEGWRRRKGAVDVTTLAEWLRVEVSAWNRVRKVAINHRHWQSRMALVKDMRRWSTGHGLRPLEVQFPRFTEEDASWLDEDVEKAADVSRMVKANGKRLETLADTIERHDGQAGSCKLVDDLERWQSELVRLDAGAHGLSRGEAARLCESHAVLWRALQGYLRDGGDQKLANAIEETERIWIAVTRSRRTDLRSNGRDPVSVEHAR